MDTLASQSPGGGKGILDCYVRNSSAFQVDNWRAEFQREELPRLCERHGYVPVVWEEQGVSGERLDKRQVMQELLRRVERGESRGLACVNFDRLSRDVRVIDGLVIWHTIEAARGVILTPDRLWRPGSAGDDDQAFINFWLAGRNKRTQLDNLYQGIVQRALHEPLVRGRTPFGYVRVLRQEADQRGRLRVWRELQIDPEAVEVVRYIFEQRPRRTLNSLRNELNLRGQSDSRWLRKRWLRDGTFVRVPWYRNDLARLCASKLYCGIVEFAVDARSNRVRDLLERTNGGQPIQHHVPGLAIVDYATWQAAQVRGVRPPASHPRQLAGGGIFTGLLHCPTCGAVMYSIHVWDGHRRHLGEGYAKIPAYRCSRYHRGGTALCQAHQIRESQLVDLLRGTLHDLLARSDLAAVVDRELDRRGQQDTAAALESRKQRLLEARQRLLDDRYTKGWVNDEEFREMLARLRADLGKTEADLLAMAGAGVGGTEAALRTLQATVRAGELADLLATEDRDWWRALVQGLFTRLDVSYRLRNRRHGPEVAITAYVLPPDVAALLRPTPTPFPTDTSISMQVPIGNLLRLLVPPAAAAAAAA